MRPPVRQRLRRLQPARSVLRRLRWPWIHSSRGSRSARCASSIRPRRSSARPRASGPAAIRQPRRRTQSGCCAIRLPRPRMSRVPCPWIRSSRISRSARCASSIRLRRSSATPRASGPAALRQPRRRRQSGCCAIGIRWTMPRIPCPWIRSSRISRSARSASSGRPVIPGMASFPTAFRRPRSPAFQRSASGSPPTPSASNAAISRGRRRASACSRPCASSPAKRISTGSSITSSTYAAAQHVRQVLGHALRPDLPELRAPLWPPVHARMGGFPRHPGFVHARAWTRLLREQPPGHVRAAPVRDRESEAIPGIRQERVGMSASDGPGPARESNLGGDRRFLRYAARGVALGRIVDDGTIAPTAAISSLPFAPEIVLPAALEMYHRFGTSIYSSYGFLDAFNASFPGPQSPPQPTLPGWVDQDYIGIDQGPILAMIENYRSALVWRVMHSNSYMREGLERAGFSGGWLEEPPLGPTPPPPGPPEQYPLVQNPLAAAALLAQSPLAPTP